VRSNDGVTVVLTDIVFNREMPRTFGNRVVSRVLKNAPGPRIGLIQRVFMVRDKPALKAELERYATLPDLKRLIVSHGAVAYDASAAAALRKAASTLA
jgi:hypothetical protein